MATVTSKNKYNRIKIYVNGTLHISLPKDDSIKLQSWFDDDESFKIEITTAGHTDWYGYDNAILWRQILAELDKHL